MTSDVKIAIWKMSNYSADYVKIATVKCSQHFGQVKIMSRLLGKYIREAKEANFGMDQARAQANAFSQLRCFVKVWAELADDTRNKNEWNNFAKYVLTEIQSMAKVIKENE